MKGGGNHGWLLRWSIKVKIRRQKAYVTFSVKKVTYKN